MKLKIESQVKIWAYHICCFKVTNRWGKKIGGLQNIKLLNKKVFSNKESTYIKENQKEKRKSLKRREMT